ncbi:hypothetical protein NPIL_552741 [Nephila pilipes]|uniref:Cell division cycle protein 26 homolog n=1 Tax=Nephila pilipes TaxID=299642 RepID=A0A8X6NUF2_NEPPI|nr:hypothetical protein NPIL_552741 [Nephila pilipes]
MLVRSRVLEVCKIIIEFITLRLRIESSKIFDMFRRKPTRIELKVEDLQEYEAMKKEIEQKNSVANLVICLQTLISWLQKTLQTLWCISRDSLV